MGQNKPKLIVIAGPNGSGKTSVTSQILKHEWVEGCIYINPDNIAQEQFGDWNSPEAVLKAAQLLFRASNGAIGKVYGERNSWALPIYESIK